MDCECSSWKEHEVIQDILEIIRYNVSNKSDIDGYIDNYLLHDILSGAEFYNINTIQFLHFCRKAGILAVKYYT